MSQPSGSRQRGDPGDDNAANLMRTTSGAPSDTQQASRQQAVAIDRRAQFERVWSTSALQNQRDAEDGLGQSWTAGFGNEFGNEFNNSVPASAGFSHGWQSGVVAAGDGELISRRSSLAASVPMGSRVEAGISDREISAPFSRSTTVAVGDRSVASLTVSTQVDPATGKRSWISSRIHDAARITDWTRVKQLCALHPEDAGFSGPDGWTALHHLCNRRCPDVEAAEAVIRACPDALVMEDKKGWYPLHYGTRFKAPREVIRLLLHLFPTLGKTSVSKPDKQRRTPLWLAVRYDAPDGVVGLLLEIDPSVVLAEDEHSESPLALVWDNWAEKSDGRSILKPFLHPDASTEPPSSADLLRKLHRQPGLHKKWLKVNMFLKAAFGFPVVDEAEAVGQLVGEHFDEKKDSCAELITRERTWRIVHATSAVKCHPTLFLMAIALHPEQASELDENDLFGDYEQKHVYASYASAQYKSPRQTPLHLAASSNAAGEAGRTVLTTLLRLFPEAAQVPDELDGSLPLHRIAENKFKRHWTVDGINPLYMVYPHAVQCRDNNGKLPLHRAAASIVQVDNDDDDEEDVGTRSIICNLLEMYPEAASEPDNTGCLPLHLIAMNAKVWDDEVNGIWEAYHPVATRRTGAMCDNSLPIHLAAKNPTARRSLIDRLVEFNPRGSSQTDRRGRLPLHLACECGKDWEEGVETIYNAFPQGVRVREENSRGWFALHMAVSSANSSSDLIDRLVELYPGATREADNSRRQPLHLACIAGMSWLGGIKTLFESNPSALSSADSSGLLPFHLAAFRGASTDPGRKIQDSVDISEELPDADLESEKAAIAAPVDILFNLLRADPTTLSSS